MKRTRKDEGYVLAALVLGLLALGAMAGGCLAPESSGATSEEVGEAPAALLATCTMTSDLCGDDGLGGSHYTLYSCVNGQAPSLKQSCPVGCLTIKGANDKCGQSYTANSTVMDVANLGNYDDAGRLLWDDDGGLLGGNRLPAATAVSMVSYANHAITRSAYQCAGFAQQASGAPLTGNWRKGDRATAACPAAGTVVATFHDNAYSGHSGMVVACTDTSLTLFDSNWIDSTHQFDSLHVGRHTFSSDGSGLHDADAYYVVLTPAP